MKLEQHRGKILVLEFGSLAMMVISLIVIVRFSGQAETPSPVMIGIPVIASLGVLVGFLADMYVRWMALAKGNQLKPIHLGLFVMMAFSVLAVWGITVVNGLMTLYG